MALPGECFENKNGGVCPECKAKLPLKVLRSNAGYYIGTWCNECGPISRETDYFKTAAQAEQVLKEILAGDTSEFRTTQYCPAPPIRRLFT